MCVCACVCACRRDACRPPLRAAPQMGKARHLQLLLSVALLAVAAATITEHVCAHNHVARESEPSVNSAQAYHPESWSAGCVPAVDVFLANASWSCRSHRSWRRCRVHDAAGPPSVCRRRYSDCVVVACLIVAAAWSAGMSRGGKPLWCWPCRRVLHSPLATAASRHAVMYTAWEWCRVVH